MKIDDARLLHRIHKDGGATKRTRISQFLWRLKPRDRERSLLRLEQAGMITERRVEHLGAGRPGTVYALTPKGRQEIERIKRDGFQAGA